MGTEEQWAQQALRNSVHRGTVSTEKQWAQRDSWHRGTVGTEKQRLQVQVSEDLLQFLDSGNNGTFSKYIQ